MLLHNAVERKWESLDVEGQVIVGIFIPNFHVVIEVLLFVGWFGRRVFVRSEVMAIPILLTATVFVILLIRSTRVVLVSVPRVRVRVGALVTIVILIAMLMSRVFIRSRLAIIIPLLMSRVLLTVSFIRILTFKYIKFTAELCIFWKWESSQVQTKEKFIDDFTEKTIVSESTTKKMAKSKNDTKPGLSPKIKRKTSYVQSAKRNNSNK